MIVLDTHALVWLDADDRRLGRKTRTLIEKHWPKYVPPAPEEQEASGAPASGEPQT